MTLTELRYVVGLAQTRHFGRAAEMCFVTQPTLSVAIRKLEEELGVKLFERGSGEILLTSVGEKIAEQSLKTLNEAARIKEIAQAGGNPLEGHLRLGVIHTIGPYLLPRLMPHMIQHYPRMPLLLQERYTEELLSALRRNELDCALLALPVVESEWQVIPLYDEPFVVAVPRNHPYARLEHCGTQDLATQDMLLLGSGHCFRDHVLAVCSEMARFVSSAPDGLQRMVEGSSLETIRHMVAAGIGITVLPSSAAPMGAASEKREDEWLVYLPFSVPAPTRRVVLLTRKGYDRVAALESLGSAILACDLSGMTRLKAMDTPV